MTQSDSDTTGLRLGDCQTLPPLDDFIDAVIERYDSDGADQSRFRQSKVGSSHWV